MAARKGLFGLTSTRAGEAAINWYPGHMASATKAIRERIKLVDLVLEVRDARIPLSSANVELQDALEHKKRLIVLNKMDLANPNMMLKWVKHFEACKQHHVFVNAHQQKAVKKMLDMARELLSERLAKEPTLLLMILGIPNVGKSALVNSLFHLSHSSTSEQEPLKKAKVGPLPGVTQDLSGFKIGVQPSVYVLDTPGILVPNINNVETGLKLALTGAVKDSVVGEERVARYLLTVLNARSAHLRWKSEVDSESLRESNVREVLSQACTNFVGNLENQQDMASLVDEQMMLLRKCFKVPSELGDAGWIRVSKQLIQLYRTGKLGRYTLDLVPSDGHQKKLNICVDGSAPS
ncbi:hypothetical protein CY35_06G081400 [Sphagnum magellanicum]|nr:hypothetical protein CY35_06G081400 [Sphagnum magellanicum]